MKSFVFFVQMYLFAIPLASAQSSYKYTYFGEISINVATKNYTEVDLNVPMKVKFRLRNIQNSKYSLVIIDNYESESNYFIKNESDTLIFDLKNRYVFDFSSKKKHHYTKILFDKFERKKDNNNILYSNKNQYIFLDKKLKKSSVPLPIFEYEEDFGISKIQSKSHEIVFSSREKTSIDIDDFLEKTKSFTYENAAYEFSLFKN
ncbi:MAG: hypothetical protein SFU27_04190 [Thermonemataceae bacterium]|nr:hypothetical protein [Thermonemataceae bacterium]